MASQAPWAVLDIAAHHRQIVELFVVLVASMAIMGTDMIKVEGCRSISDGWTQTAQAIMWASNNENLCSLLATYTYI